MATALTKLADQKVARPLRVLVPLIQEDIAHGRDAAEKAGVPYYRAAGEKMLEAKAQIAYGAFQAWIQRNFRINYSTANYWMRLAQTQKASGEEFSTLADFKRDIEPNRAKPTWQERVQQVVAKVDTETLNLAREELKRNEERDAQKQLALQLIDIGYKVLARKLHPDRGGSRDAMARLNAVRDRLRGCI